MHYDDPLPTTSLPPLHYGTYRYWYLQVIRESLLEVFWREENATVLFHQLGEIVE